MSAIARCPWTGIADPEYARYHDEEWGVPVTDDHRLFEKIVLEGFQAGLSWLTILRKRDSFRRAFRQFDPTAIAAFTTNDVERLMGDTGIVRNRAKIEATIDNARAFLRIAESASFSALIWDHLPDGPLIHARRTLADVPPRTDISDKLSRTLKAAGFRFVGSTTMYAFMQSTGMVNDHLVACPRHAACAALQRQTADPGGLPRRHD